MIHRFLSWLRSLFQSGWKKFVIHGEKKLTKFGLPIWRTKQDLASALGISIPSLNSYLSLKKRTRCSHYVTFSIPKRTGGERIICAPKPKLKALLTLLHKQLISKLEVSPYAHGFCQGRSVKTGAMPHVQKRILLRMDIKDFFPSVTFVRVFGFLKNVGYPPDIASILARLMTASPKEKVLVDGKEMYASLTERHCVQGAPTSPGICNALLLRMDRRLAGLAKKHGFSYTRYADDLTFSGESMDGAHLIRKSASFIISKEGFTVHEKKVKFLPQGRSQQVTGVTVNSILGLSRKKRRLIRSMIHKENQSPTNEKHQQKIRGLIAWATMLNQQQGEALLRQVKFQNHGTPIL